MFWGEDYLRVVPLFWNWNDNWLLLPVGGKLEDGGVAGPVVWGDDVFHVVPLFWSWNDNWVLLPVGGKLGDTGIVGPAVWGEEPYQTLLTELPWDCHGPYWIVADPAK